MNRTLLADGHRRIGAALRIASIVLAYLGGAVVVGIGLMSAVSIVGRSAMGRPITGDFELVEIGTAIGGTLFLPYCQATRGHIVVDLFTLRVNPRVHDWLDQFGSMLMAVMFFAVGWRALVGGISLRTSGETSMLLGVPTWVGYVGMLPGVFTAGIIALAQSLGINVAGRSADE